MQDVTYAYLGGLTKSYDDDGFLHVKGLATDETLDLDEQIVDKKWAGRAISEWFETGANIREMHTSSAVGKGIELGEQGSGYYVAAKVVDADARLKVEEDIYTGLSVGIKGARVVKDAKAPNGRIVGGKIVEVSLVDRPANPSCKISIAKAAGMNDEAMMEEPPGSPDELYERVEVCQACFGTGKKSNVAEGDDDTCEACDGSGKQPEGEIEDIEQNSPSQPNEDDENETDLKSADADKREFSDKERKEMASRGQAMPGGGYPIKTVEDLKNAIHAIGRAKNRAATIAHIKARAKALGRSDLIPDEWKSVDADLVKFVDALTKAASDDEWTHDPAQLAQVRDGLIALIKAELDEFAKGDDERCDVQTLVSALNMYLGWWDHEADEGETTEPFEGDTMAYVGLGVSADLIKSATADDATSEVKDELRTEIVKALGLEDITTKAELSQAKEEIELLKAELSEVKEMAAPGGPAIRATREQTSKSAQTMALEVEAQRYRNLAAQMTDPDLRSAYLTSAMTLEQHARDN